LYVKCGGKVPARRVDGRVIHAVELGPTALTSSRAAVSGSVPSVVDAPTFLSHCAKLLPLANVWMIVAFSVPSICRAGMKLSCEMGVSHVATLDQLSLGGTAAG
jgi:hypothetical protein